MCSKAGHFLQLDYGKQGLLAWLILLSKHTFRNIICILGPSDNGQQSVIQRWLKRQAVCHIIPGLGTFPCSTDDPQYTLNMIVIYPYFPCTSKILDLVQKFWNMQIWQSTWHYQIHLYPMNNLHHSTTHPAHSLLQGEGAQYVSATWGLLLNFRLLQRLSCHSRE